MCNVAKREREREREGHAYKAGESGIKASKYINLGDVVQL